MGNPIFISAVARARRAMRRHQHVPSGSRLPMWRLVLGELAHLARSAVRGGVLPAALVAALVVVLALSPATPGPVAMPWLRLVSGAVAGVGAAWAVRRVRS